MKQTFTKALALAAALLFATGASAERVTKKTITFAGLTTSTTKIPCSVSTAGIITKTADNSQLADLQLGDYTLTFSAIDGIKNTGLQLGKNENTVKIGGLANGDIVRVKLAAGRMQVGNETTEVNGLRGTYLTFVKCSDDQTSASATTNTQYAKDDVFCYDIKFLNKGGTNGTLTLVDKRSTDGSSKTGYSIIESITIESAVLPADAVTDIDFTKGVQGEYVTLSDNSFTTPSGSDKYKVKLTSTSSTMTIPAKAGTYYVSAYGGAYSSTTTTVNGTSLLGSTEGNYSKKVTLTTDGELTFTNTSGTNGQIYRLVITPEAKANLAVTLGKKGISTYTPTMNVQIPTGIKAYKVTSASGSTLTTTEITGDIPAFTGVILVGEGYQTFNFALRDSYGKQAATDNKLVGVVTDATIGGDGIYGLKANTADFVPVAADTTIPAGKAYLDLSGESTGVKMFSLDLGDEATAIETLQATSSTDGAWYNLQGVHVAQPTRGIYVHNGKKVIVK